MCSGFTPQHYVVQTFEVQMEPLCHGDILLVTKWVSDTSCHQMQHPYNNLLTIFVCFHLNYFSYISVSGQQTQTIPGLFVLCFLFDFS